MASTYIHIIYIKSDRVSRGSSIDIEISTTPKKKKDDGNEPMRAVFEDEDGRAFDVEIESEEEKEERGSIDNDEDVIVDNSGKTRAEAESAAARLPSGGSLRPNIEIIDPRSLMLVPSKTTLRWWSYESRLSNVHGAITLLFLICMYRVTLIC